MQDLLRVIFSYGFLSSVFRMATPLIFVALAALIGSKADVLCIAYEGIMLFAAFGGVIGSAYAHSLTVGLLSGFLMGLILTAIFAYFVLYLNAEPMIVGLALNIFGSAGTVFGLFLFTGSKSSSSTLASLTFPAVQIPLIKDIPVLGDILSGHNLLTYLAFVAVGVVYFLVFRTALGLRIRSVGEAPHAAESLGINVKRTKFIALMISGLLASLGGMFMSMAYLPNFSRDMISGRGFIGIAAQNLGGGRPLLTMIWTLGFGAADALGNTAQSFRLPSQFAQMTPYLVTLIGLVLMSVSVKKRSQKKLLAKGEKA
ncbi:MAG: ABC transporter permease [Eubacteriales bacterium]|nr:ABC transporter permease [Eubacteriales bacterium]